MIFQKVNNKIIKEKQTIIVKTKQKLTITEKRTKCQNLFISKRVKRIASNRNNNMEQKKNLTKPELSTFKLPHFSKNITEEHRIYKLPDFPEGKMNRLVKLKWKKKKNLRPKRAKDLQTSSLFGTV